MPLAFFTKSTASAKEKLPNGEPVLVTWKSSTGARVKQKGSASATAEAKICLLLVPTTSALSCLLATNWSMEWLLCTYNLVIAVREEMRVWICRSFSELFCFLMAVFTTLTKICSKCKIKCDKIEKKSPFVCVYLVVHISVQATPLCSRRVDGDIVVKPCPCALR